MQSMYLLYDDRLYIISIAKDLIYQKMCNIIRILQHQRIAVIDHKPDTARNTEYSKRLPGDRMDIIHQENQFFIYLFIHFLLMSHIMMLHY